MRSGIYLVDHPQRDLPSLIWWSINSQLHISDKIWLIPTKELTYSTINKLNPDFIVWNFARPANRRIMKYAYINGVINIVHDTEGIPYDLEGYFATATEGQLSCIDEIWCWGESQKEFLEKKLKDIKKIPNIICTGSIRYEYIKSLPKIKIEKNVGSGLWNTNFSTINPRYQTIQDEFNHIVYSEKLWSLEKTLKVLLEKASDREAACNGVTNILDKANINSLTIRTHPFESYYFYKERFNDYSVKINFSTSKDIHEEDLVNTSFVVHSGCQTVLDAHIRGIPCFKLDSKPINRWSLVSNELPSEITGNEFNDFSMLNKAYENQRDLFKKHKINSYLNNIENLSFNSNLSKLSSEKSVRIQLNRAKLINTFVLPTYEMAKKLQNIIKTRRKKFTKNNVESKAISSKLIIDKLKNLNHNISCSEYGLAVITYKSRNELKQTPS